MLKHTAAFLLLVCALASGKDVCEKACKKTVGNNGSDTSSVTTSLGGHFRECRVCTDTAIDCTRSYIGKWCPEWMNSEKLESLKLAMNALGERIGQQLSELRHARKLDLMGNRLTGIAVDEIAHMVNLEELTLSANQLQNLPDGLFSNLTNLLTLQLNAIGVHHFPGAIFSATEHHSLEHLELRGNALTAIPHDALARLPALRYLDLSTNPLGPRIDKPIEHDRLEELLLNACALEHIGAGTFAKLPALRKLHLSVNERLSDIDPDAFGRLSSPHQAPALTDLYLVEDDLTTLDSRTVDWLHLRLLAVRSNPWTCNCAMRWTVGTWKRDLMQHPEKTICSEPTRLRGREIANLTRDDMPCGSGHHDDGPPHHGASWVLVSAIGVLSALLLAFIVLSVLPWGSAESYTQRMFRAVRVRSYSSSSGRNQELSGERLY